MAIELATFGAGCFWGVEQRFREVDGVTEAAVGYMGGHVENPTYPQVCTGNTGHAEVVELQFDTERVSYEQLLDVFFDCHNPTTLNRQGPDVGHQYRSVIFTRGPQQAEAAQRAVEQADESGRWSQAVVTEVSEASTFWRAEEYHQQYLAKNDGAYCHV